MTKKTEPAKKKRKSVKQPERGKPKMRTSLGKLRQITAQAIVRKEAEELARKTREEQDAAREREKQKARDVESARRHLVQVGKIARAAALDGESKAVVFRLDRDDLDLVAGVASYSPDALIGPARHVYEALADQGFVVEIIDETTQKCLQIRWL